MYRFQLGHIIPKIFTYHSGRFILQDEGMNNDYSSLFPPVKQWKTFLHLTAVDVLPLFQAISLPISHVKAQMYLTLPRSPKKNYVFHVYAFLTYNIKWLFLFYCICSTTFYNLYQVYLPIPLLTTPLSCQVFSSILFSPLISFQNFPQQRVRSVVYIFRSLSRQS